MAKLGQLRSVGSELSFLFSFPPCSVDKDRQSKFNTFETKTFHASYELKSAEKLLLKVLSVSLNQDSNSRESCQLRETLPPVLFSKHNTMSPAPGSNLDQPIQNPAEKLLGHLPHPLVLAKSRKFELTCKFAAVSMTCLPYNPFLKLLRTPTREVLGFMRRGYLETMLPRENAGMDRADSHVTTDR